jgi:hypothetical protein
MNFPDYILHMSVCRHMARELSAVGKDATV